MRNLTRSCGTQNFYLDIRKTLLHPWCVTPKGEKGAIKTSTKGSTEEGETKKAYEEYQAQPSGKLERLVAILRHHLASDGASEMRTMEQEEKEEASGPSQQQQSQQQPQPPPPPPQQQQQQQQHGPPLPPDKIIVYSYFPSSFWLIKLVSDPRFFVKKVSGGWTNEEQVLEANGIKVVTMHGGLSQQKCVDLLNQFRYCDRNGARVLLISNVGSVGLNIACANILIIVVRRYDCERHHPK